MKGVMFMGKRIRIIAAMFLVIALLAIAGSCGKSGGGSSSSNWDSLIWDSDPWG